MKIFSFGLIVSKMSITVRYSELQVSENALSEAFTQMILVDPFSALKRGFMSQNSKILQNRLSLCAIVPVTRGLLFNSSALVKAGATGAWAPFKIE